MRKAVPAALVLSAVLASSCGGTQSASSSSSVQTGKAGDMTVTFLSAPDPPKSGDNSFLVTVKQPDGTPVTDGQVKAVFSMPAMPSMNMPAMRADAALMPQGSGVYRGTGQLSMSGTWNVEVSSRAVVRMWVPPSSAWLRNQRSAYASFAPCAIRIGALDTGCPTNSSEISFSWSSFEKAWSTIGSSLTMV